MGTDITTYMEIWTGEKWAYVGNIRLDRHYNLFGILANVREEAEELDGKPAVGTPMNDLYDCSQTVSQKIEADWWHDITIVTTEGMKEAVSRLLKLKDPGNPEEVITAEQLQEEIACLKLLEKTEAMLGTKARMVCLFDS
jgi:hypothetical protein